MAQTLKDLTIGVSPLTNRIYAGYANKKNKNLFTSKVDVTDQVIRALKEHLAVYSKRDDQFGGYAFDSGTIKWVPQGGDNA